VSWMDCRMLIHSWNASDSCWSPATHRGKYRVCQELEMAADKGTDSHGKQPVPL
jgi:hypothetical protein